MNTRILHFTTGAAVAHCRTVATRDCRKKHSYATKADLGKLVKKMKENGFLKSPKG